MLKNENLKESRTRSAYGNGLASHFGTECTRFPRALDTQFISSHEKSSDGNLTALDAPITGLSDALSLLNISGLAFTPDGEHLLVAARGGLHLMRVLDGLVPFDCGPDAETLCLRRGRFKVEVDWTTSTGTGPGVVVPGGTGDSSNLWFFSANNWELLIKVLDGCGINNNFWVFFAATTDVGFTVTVTDTQEDEVRVYTNPLGQAANAVTDTSAFATCP